MNIVILNKSKAERLSYTDYLSDKVVISIRNPNDKKAEFNPGNSTIKDVLYLDFYDISIESQDVFRGYISMCEEDAIQGRDFVTKWKDKVDALWIHCDMGISRSAGVAAGILEAFGKDTSHIFNSKIYYPNMLCYQKTLNAFKNKS